MTVEIVNEVGVTLIEASASDDMVAMAAWVSHDADSEDRLKNVEQIRKLIHFLYSNRHMSPFEHGHFTFKIDAPLFVAREFFRHRTASYNEVSGRYTEMKPRFYASTVAREQHGKPGDYYFEDGTNDQTAIYLQTKRKAVKKAWNVYQERLEAGIAKEQAREELPLSLMTQWYVTMNPRNLMQFLTLRNEKHALKEIQDVAVKMEAIFKEQMPVTYAAYEAGRKQEEFAGSATMSQLQSKIRELEYAVSKLDKTNSDLESRLDGTKRAKADIETRYYDLLNDYNRKFVAEKEAEKDDAIQVGSKWDKKAEDLRTRVEDSVIPAVGRLVESAAPVYNIYVDNKDREPAEIAKAVLKSVREAQRRRGQ